MVKTALLGSGALIGGVLAISSVPMVLGIAGFTKVGIAAGSLAAKMMSAAAVANGGGVASGSLVAVLQSAGAAGLSTASSAAVGTAGSCLGSLLVYFHTYLTNSKS